MKHDDETGEDILGTIDLQAWQVPPPVAAHRPAILLRALSPAAAPRRRRLVWLVAAAALVNALIAAILVIIISRPPSQPVTVVPAGGGGTDARVQELLRRMEREQNEIEQKLAEIKELRRTLDDLAAKVREYEAREAEIEALEKKLGIRRTIAPKKQPAPVPPPPDQSNDPVPSDPYNDPHPPVATCDEVSCVLGNYEGPCCLRYRKGARPAPVQQPVPGQPGYLPETLDRTSISDGIAKVKASVTACGDGAVKGKVKVSVKVASSGRVTSVTVDAAPTAKLGACVAAAVQRAVFARTQLGGSFSYPFIF